MADAIDAGTLEDIFVWQRARDLVALWGRAAPARVERAITGGHGTVVSAREWQSISRAVRRILERKSDGKTGGPCDRRHSIRSEI